VTPLADQLQARADALVAHALQAMYTNPFWEERFGERGRQFARADNHHHLSYLALALRVGSPEPLARYARWLQEVLTDHKGLGLLAGMFGAAWADRYVGEVLFP
jgi:hypothetical protein